MDARSLIVDHLRYIAFDAEERGASVRISADLVRIIIGLIESDGEENLSVAAATSPLSGETRGEAAGWISVEDRLPEAYETVLFTGVNKYGNRYRTQRGYYCGGDVWYSEIVPGKKVENGVTHWMPLPEGPEEGEAE